TGVRRERSSEAHDLEREPERGERRGAREESQRARDAPPARRLEDDDGEDEGRENDEDGLREERKGRERPGPGRQGAFPPRVRAAREGRARERAADARRLKRLGPVGPRVGPQRRRDRGGEASAARSFRSPAHGACEQARCAGREEDQQDLLEDEKRLRRAQSESVLEGARERRERNTNERRAHSVPRHGVPGGPRDVDRVASRDPYLSESGHRVGLAGHDLPVSDQAEDALVRRERDHEGRDAERKEDGAAVGQRRHGSNDTRGSSISEATATSPDATMTEDDRSRGEILGSPFRRLLRRLEAPARGERGHRPL